MNNQNKIDRIDEVLAQCEDILHGQLGEDVTTARKLLSQLATNDGSASVSDWVANSEQTPKYDGNYLCYINQPQECGNIWKYYKAVYREMGKWVIDDDEEVIFWTDKAFPKHISPEPPCR